MFNEILSNDDLIVGNYYHCFWKSDGRHSINQCRDSQGHKYINCHSSTIWASDNNNQALERWRILPIEVPQLDTIYLCVKHHGIGFQSDCHLCKKESKLCEI